jgi:hypothetical protein
VGRGHQGRAWFRRRSESGAALVEAAIILPLIMVLTFGAIELGIGFSQKGALESAARGGARKAATLTSEPEPQFSSDIVDAVNGALDSSAVPTLDQLTIYKDTGVSPPATGCGALSDCETFSPGGNPKHFDASTRAGLFPDTDRQGCGATPDKVSVRVKGEFHFLSGLIGKGNVTLIATTTLTFEPTNCT